MEKLSRYYGIVFFILGAIAILVISYFVVTPCIEEKEQITASIEELNGTLSQRKTQQENIKRKIKKLSDSIINSQKKVYSPIETGMENETLFFNIYNDIIEMLHGNSIKIKSIDYAYNPESDPFVKLGKELYFVCDVNMEIVSNYVNLGKFIQDIYQYPYYVRINSIDTRPYQRDKKILISNISLRLYARTEPYATEQEGSSESLNNAKTPLPQG